VTSLFEPGSSLNNPIECFVFGSPTHSFPVRPHWHYFYEIIYILDGCAEMHSSDRSGADRCYHLSQGDMIVFHSQSVHSIFTDSPEKLRYAVLKFDISQFGMTSVYAPKLRSIFRYAEKSGMNIYFPADAANRMGCATIFSVCLNEATNHEYGCDIMMQAQIYTLLMGIVRSWMDDGMVISSRDFPQGESCDIESVTEYIDGHIDEHIRVEDIARECGLSYSCFAKKFRETYNMSCKEYIERMRIFKAEDFLLFTDFDLTYIAQETGFSDCSHLIKSFRRLRGMTPKKFRDSHKRKDRAE